MQPRLFFVNEHFNDFLDHAADQIYVVQQSLLLRFAAKQLLCMVGSASLSNVVFSLTVCHFKRVFSDSAV